MKMQLSNDVNESQTPVDQEDTSTLPGITLKPYGIENIELGHPVSILNTETSEVNVVTVNGVAIEKTVYPQIIGSGITDLSSISPAAFNSLSDSIIPTYNAANTTQLMDLGNIITMPTNLNAISVTTEHTTSSELVYSTRDRSLTISTNDATTTKNTVAAPFENELSLRFLLDNIIARANKAGFVVTIDLVPNQPLAMGNYDMVPSIRRKNYR